MTADAIVLYDIFTEELGKEGHNLNAGDTIKVALMDSGYTPAKTTDVDFSVIDADELSTANGYTAGGVAIATTWDTAASILTFDGVNPSWASTGAGITARYAVLYNSSKGGSNDLIGYWLLDNSPADVTAPAGSNFVLDLPALGILTIP